MTVKTFGKKMAPLAWTVAGTLMWVAPVLASAAPNLYFNPSTTQVVTGQMVTVQVREDSGTTPVNAVQTNISYPSDMLEMKYINVVGSEFQITAEQTTGDGTIRIVRGRQGDPLTGSRQIAQITFVAKTPGTATLKYTPGSVVVKSADNTSDGAALDSASVTILDKPGSAVPVSTVSPTPGATPAATPSATPRTLPEAGSDQTPTSLPQTGTTALAGMAGLVTIGGTALAYARSRRELKSALRQ